MYICIYIYVCVCVFVLVSINIAQLNSVDTYSAIKEQQTEIATLLIQHPKLDLRSRDNEGHTVFGEAVAMRNSVAAAAIRQREPHVAEEPGENGMTHLHAAIVSKDSEAIMFLLQHGANPNSAVRDATSWTPLYMAIERGLDDVVAELLQAGADPSQPDKSSQWTPAHMAASLGSVPVLEALLRYKANFAAVDGQGNSVLHAAVLNCHADVVTRLLSLPQCIPLALQPNKQGETPLHSLATIAARQGDNAVRVLQLLHPHLNDQLNPQDVLGNTPLYYGCLTGASKFCGSLVRNGGQLALPNAQGNEFLR